MTPAVVDRPFQGFGYYLNTGIGTESKNLEELLRSRFREATCRPIILSGKLDTLGKLGDVFLECQAANWDGEGAAAISLKHTVKHIILLACFH